MQWCRRERERKRWEEGWRWTVNPPSIVSFNVRTCSLWETAVNLRRNLYTSCSQYAQMQQYMISVNTSVATHWQIGFIREASHFLTSARSIGEVSKVVNHNLLFLPWKAGAYLASYRCVCMLWCLSLSCNHRGALLWSVADYTCPNINLPAWSNISGNEAYSKRSVCAFIVICV